MSSAQLAAGLLRSSSSSNVRFWHKADITAVLIHVRFWG
jgi:hypothetical protein